MLRNFVFVIVAEADHIVVARFRHRLCQIIEVVYRESLAVEFLLKQFAVKVAVGFLSGLRSDPIQIGIVIAKHDMNIAWKLREFVDNKWRTQIAAANQGVGILDRVHGGGQVPQVVVDIRNNRDAHGLFVEISVPGVPLQNREGLRVQFSRACRPGTALNGRDAPHSRNHRGHGGI